MHKHRVAERLLCLVLLLGLHPGCQLFPSGRPLAVLVRDAETKKPIATAEVYLCQRLKPDEVAPCRSSAFTQANGIARLRAGPAGGYGLQVQAVAQGYLPEKVNVSADALQTNTAAGSSAKSKPRRPDLVVEVYAEPTFRVELVVPPGYRGLVKAEIQLQDNLPIAPGQRCFQFPVSSTGEVQVRGPSLLQRIDAADYRARYANGPLLAPTLDAEKIGFRWLKGVGNRHYFVVGTLTDYEALHRQLVPEETRAASGSGIDAPDNRKHKYRYGYMTAPKYER